MDGGRQLRVPDQECTICHGRMLDTPPDDRSEILDGKEASGCGRAANGKAEPQENKVDQAAEVATRDETIDERRAKYHTFHSRSARNFLEPDLGLQFGERVGIVGMLTAVLRKRPSR